MTLSGFQPYATCGVQVMCELQADSDNSLANLTAAECITAQYRLILHGIHRSKFKY